MSDIMFMDIGTAVSLQRLMLLTAERLDADAHMLAQTLNEASQLLPTTTTNVVPGVKRAASNLRVNAKDLESRIKMLLAGGPEAVRGLAALERVRINFSIIDTRGDTEHADGKVSLSDLRWASRAGSPVDAKTRAAAAWLADNQDFFATAETADENNSYIAEPYSSRFVHNPEHEDGMLSVADIDAFFAKIEAWATLMPYAARIDIAGAGGKRDGGKRDGRLTKKDFEAFLANNDDLPRDVVRAARQVMHTEAYHKPAGFFKGLLNWNNVLDATSLIPVLGDVVDGARSIYYAINGDWEASIIYAIGLVPLPGLSGSGVKASWKVSKQAAETFSKHGWKAATKSTASNLRKGTMYNWTAKTAANSLASKSSCQTTQQWIAEQAGINLKDLDIREINEHMREATGADAKRIRNRLSDATGYNLSAKDGFFSDTCEVIAQRLGEHKFSKLWLTPVTPVK